jgi:predicted nucleotide-binding protein (sugar kinase/HSP70/actin superfamily)
MVGPRHRSVTRTADAFVHHFRRPVERPFPASERGRTTILFGGLTSAHERLIEAVFHACGYRCRRLPTPDLAAFHLGREYCNTGQCNPTYFTIGSLLSELFQLESQGYSRRQIIDQFVLFTAGSCGPCRFGMYESEYRLALQNAGFDGFRVLLFQQDQGISTTSGEPGLKFTLNFGLGALNAFNIGDVLQDLGYQLRPYEITPGDTDRALADCLHLLVKGLRAARPADPLETIPAWLWRLSRRRRWLRETLNCLGKLHFHLYSDAHMDLLRQCRDRLDRIDIDRTRIKPIVKITGEFWAQTTEGDGNYRMFAFLEHEGAQVLVEPVGTWVMYLLDHAKGQALARKGLHVPHPDPPWWHVRKRVANGWQFEKRRLLLSIGEVFFARQFHRAAAALGGITSDFVPQRELARLAHPYYHSLSRGGEGHLEVAKNLYYTQNRRCHMVLSLKPFGCMPSLQSDGVQSAVVHRFPEMNFLPVETSGEGEVNAHSRAQMALTDAKARARAEFDEALRQTGKRLEDIRAFAARRPGLRRPFYPLPRRAGIAGVAANFVTHVSDLMDAARE